MIKVDEQGNDALKQLCDIALKFGGITNLQGVVSILQSIKLEVPDNTEVVEN